MKQNELGYMLERLSPDRGEESAHTQYTYDMRDNWRSAGNQQERLLLHPQYIVGLVDGEGYFSVSTRQRLIDRWTIKEVSLKFGVEMRLSDRPMLEKVRDTLGVGKLYTKRDKRSNFTDLCVYRVERHPDIIKVIVPFFQQYPLQTPSKRKTFQMFAEIANMVKEKRHARMDVFEEIQSLAKTMH